MHFIYSNIFQILIPMYTLNRYFSFLLFRSNLSKMIECFKLISQQLLIRQNSIMALKYQRYIESYSGASISLCIGKL